MKILKILIFLVLVAAVVGYFRDWYSFSKPDDKSLTVTLNKEKVKEDVGKATDKAKEVAGNVKEKLAGEHHVTGRLSGVDLLASTLRVKPAEGDEVVVKWSKESLGTADLAVLTALATGDTVSVDYETKDGVHHLKKIQKTP